MFFVEDVASKMCTEINRDAFFCFVLVFIYIYIYKTVFCFLNYFFCLESFFCVFLVMFFFCLSREFETRKAKNNGVEAFNRRNKVNMSGIHFEKQSEQNSKGRTFV